MKPNTKPTELINCEIYCIDSSRTQVLYERLGNVWILINGRFDLIFSPGDVLIDETGKDVLIDVTNREIL